MRMSFCRSLFAGFFFAGLILAGTPGLAGRPAVLPESCLRLIGGEVNGYAAFNNLAVIATYHRTLGSDQTHEILLRLQKKCRDYGLKSTEILRVPVKTGYEFFGLQNFDGQVPTRVGGADGLTGQIREVARDELVGARRIREHGFDNRDARIFHKLDGARSGGALQ